LECYFIYHKEAERAVCGRVREDLQERRLITLNSSLLGVRILGAEHSRAPPLKLSAAMAITLRLILLLGTLLSQRRRPTRRGFFSFLAAEARVACLRDRRVSTRCLHATGIEKVSSSNLTLTKYMSLAILVWT
jgi:hypothetical protein